MNPFIETDCILTGGDSGCGGGKGRLHGKEAYINWGGGAIAAKLVLPTHI